MRIVDRKTFLAMPTGTVFARYEPCIFGPLSIKDDSLSAPDRGPFDFYYMSLVDAVDYHNTTEFASLLDAAEKTGSAVPMDFDTVSRDGMFDEDQLFAVWEPEDVRKLIARLERTLPGG